jgi:hypothetical protein
MKEAASPFRSMAAKWPSSVVSRSEVPTFTGGLMTEKYIANLDSAGLGPAGRLRVGKKIAYPVESLILWMEQRSSAIQQRRSGYVSGKFPGQRKTG